MQQLRYLSHISVEEKRIASYLIGNLNESGYLDIPLHEAAENLGVPEEKVEHGLRLVQSLDPAGVGARELRECLTLQLKRMGEADPLVYRVVQDHLEDLAANRCQKVAAQLQVDPTMVQMIFDMIRLLDPKPGSQFHHDQPRFIIPDVTVERVEGEYVVLVNDQATPRLSINGYYEKLIRSRQEQDDAKQFIHDKLNAAMWLIRSLEQRRMTLYRVMEAVVQAQRDFFDHGLTRLRPLTLREIAERLDLHESTISRATNNKYVQTPRGIFELKYFFTSGVGMEDGGSASSESVKLMIKNLIEEEDKKKPLSDQILAEKLKKEGISISRRTVAKYREEIRIPSSAKRKRLG